MENSSLLTKNPKFKEIISKYDTKLIDKKSAYIL